MPDIMITDSVSDDVLSQLLDPSDWRVVCSALPREVEPIEAPEHREWARTNSHAHAHVEVFGMVQGTGLETYRGDVFPALPQTFFVFDSFEEHDFGRPPWVTDATELWIHPLQQHVVVILERIVGGKYSATERTVLPLPWEEIGLAPGTRFAPDADLARLAPEAARLRLVGTLATVIAAVALRELTPDAAAEKELPERVIDAVCNHIRHTAGRDATIEHLAKIAGYSPFHFLRLFKQHTGMTVHDYINQCRIERVEEMQGFGARQKEIAADLGFSSPATFSRWYHRTFRAKEAESR